MPLNLDIRKCICLGILFAFLANTLGPVPMVYAQDFLLPKPGTMLSLSPVFAPPILKGIKVHPDNPFRFDFILDKGDGHLSGDQLKDESTKLIKYFLASLTIPEKDLWVNLSPYEKDRIVPVSFGQTEMGRDLLAEDYMLKQITASLIYPEGETGKKFWKRVYEEAYKKFGTTDIPVNTFNKVWIVPQKALVYENAKAGTAYVIESKLKVMLEQDYLSLQKHAGTTASIQKQETNQLGSQIVREIVIPELTKEVNEDKNFSQLRQVYNSLILATWYKKKIKDSILEQVYADKNKTSGINIDDPQEKERIYHRYLEAFKKGVYNFIKETDSPNGVSAPRKYFSGGMNFYGHLAMTTTEEISSKALLSGNNALLVEEKMDIAPMGQKPGDMAMNAGTRQEAREVIMIALLLKVQNASADDKYKYRKAVSDFITIFDNHQDYSDETIRLIAEFVNVPGVEKIISSLCKKGNQPVGAFYELKHAHLLEKEGYKILAFNFKIKSAQIKGNDLLEIDSFAEKDGEYYFIEIKNFDVSHRTPSDLVNRIRKRATINKFERYGMFYADLKESTRNSSSYSQIKEILGERVADSLLDKIERSAGYKLKLISSSSLDFTQGESLEKQERFMLNLADNPSPFMECFRAGVRLLNLVYVLGNEAEGIKEEVAVTGDIVEEVLPLSQKTQWGGKIESLMGRSYFVHADITYINKGGQRERMSANIEIYNRNFKGSGKKVLYFPGGPVDLDKIQEIKVYYLLKSQANRNTFNRHRAMVTKTMEEIDDPEMDSIAREFTRRLGSPDFMMDNGFVIGPRRYGFGEVPGGDLYRLGSLMFITFRKYLGRENLTSETSIKKLIEHYKRSLGDFYDKYQNNILFVSPFSAIKRMAINYFTAALSVCMSNQKELIKGATVVDFGSGSGGLALLALRLGAKKVILIDDNKEETDLARVLLVEQGGVEGENFVIINKGFHDVGADLNKELAGSSRRVGLINIGPTYGLANRRALELATNFDSIFNGGFSNGIDEIDHNQSLDEARTFLNKQGYGVSSYLFQPRRGDPGGVQVLLANKVMAAKVGVVSENSPVLLRSLAMVTESGESRNDHVWTPENIKHVFNSGVNMPYPLNLVISNIKERKTTLADNHKDVKIHLEITRKANRYRIDVFVNDGRTGDIEIRTRRDVYNKVDIYELSTFFPIGNFDDTVNGLRTDQGISSSIMNWIAWVAHENNAILEGRTSTYSLLRLLGRFIPGITQANVSFDEDVVGTLRVGRGQKPEAMFRVKKVGKIYELSEIDWQADGFKLPDKVKIDDKGNVSSIDGNTNFGKVMFIDSTSWRGHAKPLKPPDSVIDNLESGTGSARPHMAMSVEDKLNQLLSENRPDASLNLFVDSTRKGHPFSDSFLKDYFKKTFLIYLSFDDFGVTNREIERIRQELQRAENPYEAVIGVFNERQTSNQAKNYIVKFLPMFISKTRELTPFSRHFEEMLFQYYSFSNFGEALKNRYQFVKYLGAGNQGIVFKVHDLKDGGYYAVKFVSGDMRSRSAKFRERLKDNPRVMQNYEIGMVGNYTYIVKEFLDGQEFDDKDTPELLKEKNYGPSQRAEILIELTDVLDELLGKGIFPGDFQFMEVGKGKSVQIKMFDFGHWDFFDPQEELEAQVDDEDGKIFSEPFRVFFARMLKLIIEDSDKLKSSPNAVNVLIDKIDQQIKRHTQQRIFDFNPYLLFLRGVLNQAIDKKQEAAIDFKTAWRGVSTFHFEKEIGDYLTANGINRAMVVKNNQAMINNTSDFASDWQKILDDAKVPAWAGRVFLATGNQRDVNRCLQLIQEERQSLNDYLFYIEPVAGIQFPEYIADLRAQEIIRLKVEYKGPEEFRAVLTNRQFIAETIHNLGININVDQVDLIEAVYWKRFQNGGYKDVVYVTLGHRSFVLYKGIDGHARSYQMADQEMREGRAQGKFLRFGSIFHLDDRKACWSVERAAGNWLSEVRWQTALHLYLELFTQYGLSIHDPKINQVLRRNAISVQYVLGDVDTLRRKNPHDQDVINDFVYSLIHFLRLGSDQFEEFAKMLNEFGLISEPLISFLEKRRYHVEEILKKFLKPQATPADQSQQLKKSDAMTTRLPGGIDFAHASGILQSKDSGVAIKFHLNPAQLAQLQNAPGFVPVIINIQPMTDLRRFLGVQEAPATAV